MLSLPGLRLPRTFGTQALLAATPSPLPVPTLCRNAAGRDGWVPMEAGTGCVSGAEQ